MSFFGRRKRSNSSIFKKCNWIEMTRPISAKSFSFFILHNLEPPETDLICHFSTKFQCLLVRCYNIFIYLPAVWWRQETEVALRKTVMESLHVTGDTVTAAQWSISVSGITGDARGLWRQQLSFRCPPSVVNRMQVCPNQHRHLKTLITN